MSDELHADAMKRKRLTHECIHEAGGWIDKIFWLHPNGQPVYLDYDDRRSLEGIRTAVEELLERHKEAEKAL